VSQKTLGKVAGLDPNTTSQIIKGLEKKKLVKRDVSSDARIKNPFLTTKGKSILSKAMPKVEKADQAFFHSLSPKENETMLKIFQKLSND